MHMLRTALTITAVLLLVGAENSRAAESGQPEEFELLTPKNADRRHVDVYPGTTLLKQLYFEVNLEYPNASIGSAIDTRLSANGWRPCAARDSSWVSIPDNSDESNPQCHYVLNKSFIKANDLLLISMRYRAKLAKKWSCAPKPDNSRQLVTVLIYKFPDRASMRLEKQGLSCPE
ncbi:MAG: hypothetical protein OEW21_13625 [Betaproteobacteria bacterium]|nr:hypothetical protein [Betaproteobacteria bacterium]